MEEGGLISVDKWRAGSQAYFLTHLHADHTRGLTSTWSNGPIYCSRLTAKLFPFRFPGFDLSLLRVLDTGSWYTLPLLSLATSGVRVMAIDAHHCPGSVMFLFRGELGCRLYTGDFRWEAGSARARSGRAMLLGALKDESVHMLYLDNTYCNPSYEFPPREVAAQQVVDIIASHPQHDIVIGIDSLGKEDLLLHIAQVLKTKIWVWPERLQTMHLLGFHDIFTTKTTLTRVRAVPRYSFSIETLEGLNAMRPTIGIMPSGLPWVKQSKKDDNLFASLLTSRYKKKEATNDGTSGDKLNRSLQRAEKFHKYMYSVPYSDHSCFAEIQEFIELVEPTNLKGIVSLSSCYVDPIYYFGRLCGASQLTYRECYMNQIMQGGKRDDHFQIKNCHENGDSAEPERKRSRMMGDFRGLRVNRVRALRRVGCGAKISEDDSSD